MFERDRHDRGALVALGLILAAVVLVAVVATLGNPLCEVVTPPGSQAIQAQEQQPSPPVICSDENFHFYGDSWAQWLMTFFSVLATGVSAYAVKVVRDTFKETKRTADAAVGGNRHASDAAYEQRKAVLLAEDANKHARHTSWQQLRAYLGAENFQIDAGTQKITFDVVNFGQTIAKDVSVTTRITIAGLILDEEPHGFGLIDPNARSEGIAIYRADLAPAVEAIISGQKEGDVKIEVVIRYADYANVQYERKGSYFTAPAMRKRDGVARMGIEGGTASETIVDQH